eukprot:SAG11_NODE_271_length_11328_cov_3.757859_10_plen_235_part_00
MKERKLPNLNSYSKSVLIGTLVGDASILERNNRHQIKWEQKEASKDYVYHIQKIFQPWINKTEPRLRRIKASIDKEGRQWKQRNSYVCRTLTHSIWDFYANQFYVKKPGDKKRTKVVPKLIHRWLDPVALAYWYMDDGHLHNTKKSVWLHTQNFSLTENRILQQALGRSFGFKVSIHKDNRKNKTLYYLYICAESRNDFFRIVSPYMHPNFEYKLPKEYVFIGPRRREWYGFCK